MVCFSHKIGYKGYSYYKLFHIISINITLLIFQKFRYKILYLYHQISSVQNNEINLDFLSMSNLHMFQVKFTLNRFDMIYGIECKFFSKNIFLNI